MAGERLAFGLWKDTQYSGYKAGKPIEINGKFYWMNLYKNDRKEKETEPDLRLVLKETGPPRDRASSRGADEFNDDIPF